MLLDKYNRILGKKFGKNIRQLSDFIETKVLYDYSMMKKLDFHEYIDGVPKLLLIAQLVNGRKVVGFSSEQIHPSV